MITTRALSEFGRATPGLSTQHVLGGHIDLACWNVATTENKQAPLLIVEVGVDNFARAAGGGNFVILPAAGHAGDVEGLPAVRHICMVNNAALNRTWLYHFSSTSAVDECFEERAIANDAKLAIEAISLNAAIPHRDLIASRLRALLEEFAAENDGKTFSGPSVRGLTSFLLANRFVKRPTLSITDAGLVYARWRQDTNSIFSVQFLSDRQAEFVLFTPSAGGRSMLSDTGTPERIGALATISKLAWVRA